MNRAASFIRSVPGPPPHAAAAGGVSVCRFRPSSAETCSASDPQNLAATVLIFPDKNQLAKGAGSKGKAHIDVPGKNTPSRCRRLNTFIMGNQLQEAVDRGQRHKKPL